MDPITSILSALGGAVGAVNGTIELSQWLARHIRAWARKERTEKVLRFLGALGCLTEPDVRKLVENWKPPAAVDTPQREELIRLLFNLARGARFHTTQGTALSGFLRCSHLIEQLLANIKPNRRQGEPVGPGWGDWKLERFLGMGSFGEVWLGRNPHFPEPRAFKFFTQADARDWIGREQHALYHIKDRLEDDPNIIEFHNVVIDQQKWPFLVLEYVGGGSLEDWILSHPEDRRSLNLRELMGGIVRGLAAAHDRQITHRDLKPGNILLTADTDIQPKIADFGLSRVELKASEARPALASQVVVVGTRTYLPPEASDSLEPRSPAQDDVFAFGVIWYQALIGHLDRPPYDFADQLQQQGTDSHTIRLISRCLAHPSRRFKDAKELRAAMEDIIPTPSWSIPKDCFDVGPLACEYLNAQAK